MASIQHLPIELLDNVFFCLETPQDLLHTALTCKAFYKLIVPTYRLHFASISCASSYIPWKFWEKLSNSPRLCSTVRQLEIYDDDNFYSRVVSNMRRFHGFRINYTVTRNWKFIDPDWRIGSQGSYKRNEFEVFIRCLANFHNFRSITFYHDFSAEECDSLFALISSHLSNTLQNLVIHCGLYGDIDFVPKHLSADCSFARMETFHFHLRYCEKTLREKIAEMLDALISTCSTLVDFMLYLTHHDGGHFTYSRLMKHANWPLLKKLRLGGKMQLFDPQEESASVYASFLERHSQLESLYLDLDDDYRVPYRTELSPHVLPKLRSLSTTFVIHPGILPRLQHISNFQVFGRQNYRLASSLRSCVLNVCEDDEACLDVIQAVPHLERLCLVLEYCMDSCEHKCLCLSNYAPVDEMRKMDNLTHLGFSGENICQGGIQDLLKDLFKHLPKLSHVYINETEDRRGLPEKIRIWKNHGGVMQMSSSKEPVDPDWSDDFFNRMMDDILR